MSYLPDSAVGALLALFGVLTAQLVAMVQSRLERVHRKNVLPREKYEALSAHVNDSLAWAMACLTAATFLELNAHAQPLSSRKAYTLCLLYFPLLKTSAEEYVEACVSFQMILTKTFVPNPNLDAGGQAAKNIGREFSASGERLRAAREAFDSKIQEHSATYIRD